MIKQKPYLTILLSFLFAFMSAYFLVLIHRGKNVHHFNWVFILGALLYVFIVFYHVVKRAYDNEFATQLVWLSTVIWLISMFILKQLVELTDIYYSLFTLAYFVPAFIVVVDDLRFSSGVIRGKLKHITMKESLCFGVLIMIMLLLSWQKNTYYMHDCHIFYGQISALNSVLDLFDLEKLSLAGHVSIAYAFVGTLCRLIWNSAVTGFNMYAKILMIIATYGYWKLMRLLYPDKGEIEYFMLTLVFSGSPYVLGMVAFNSYDYATWCVFPLLAYFLFSKKYIYTFGVAFYFVFCKEPCVVAYSFFLLGIYIVECVKRKKLIHDVARYAGLLTPCFLWLFSYLFIVHWEFSGGAILSLGYALNKLKSFTFINFNYLFILFAVLAVILVVRYHKSYVEYFIPITISAIAFVILSIFTNSAGMMHARYIDALIAQVHILSSFIPAIIVNKLMIKRIIYVIASALSVISSFWTIDPIGKMAYNVINVGTTEVISMNGTELSDAGVYNRQQQNFASITDMALSDICLDSQNIIYMPAEYGITEYFDSLGFYTVVNEGEEAVNTEYWNDDRKTRMTDYGSEDSYPFDIHFIVDTNPIEILGESTGYFLYTDYAGQELAASIASEHSVVSVDEFEKNGWIIKRMEFKAKH